MTDAAATPRSLAWVRRLVAIDTTSRDSNLPLIEVVAQYLREHDVEPHVLPDESGRKANLVATIPAADGGRVGGVVLSGHTDVVPVDGQEWDSDPFEAVVRDGRLYGRGTADMKGFIAVALEALPRMLATPLNEPIHLALTYDEEVGCLGGAQIVKQIADLGIAPRACIVGEPTSMRVITGHKSMNVVAVTFTGVAAHSSLTPNGVNAIEYAAAFIRFVREQAQRWREAGPFDEAYPVAYTTGGVNVVAGGIASNTVADRCRLELDFRTIPAVAPGNVLELLRGEAARLEQLMQAENPGASVDVEVLAAVPSFEAEDGSRTVELAVALGATEAAERVTYGTEAGQFAGTGIDTIVCGPGDIAQAHGPNEYVDLAQLLACEAFVDRLIEHLRAGD
ncbi:acetylornithine deacetylase [Kineosphaera limosa]|nr:acetylornithine deacetylase [Kineosphaera limosa]NYD98997.1 acetylornithine deacetylase [Kineosphaera limosa]